MADFNAKNPQEAMNQAFYKIAGQQAEQDAAYGAPVYQSQSPSVGAKIQGPATQPSPDQHPLLANLDSQLKLASSTEDPMETAKILANVKGSIAKTSAEFYKETQAVAHAEYQIPSLEAALKQSIQMDDASPGYRQKYGVADSDETASVRSHLMQAKAAADASIKERLAGNSVYQGLMAKAKAAETFTEYNIQKNLSRDAALQAKAEEFYYNIPPEQKKLFDEAIGNQEGDPRKALANLSRIHGSPEAKKQMEAVMEGGEAALPKLAIGGNLFAKRIAIQRESKVLGTPEIAAAKIADLEKISTDSRLALETFTKMKAAGVYGSGKEVDDLSKRLTLALGPASGTSAADKQVAAAARVDIAQKAGRYITEKEFESDVMALRHKSQVPPPAWLEAAAASGKIGKIDKTAAISLINSASTTQERQQRAAEFSAYYGSAVQHQNKSILFQVSPLANEKLKAEISLMGVFGKAVGKAAEMLPTFGIPNLDIQSYMQQQVER